MRQPLHVSMHWPAAEVLYVYICALCTFQYRLKKMCFQGLKFLKLITFTTSFLSEADLVLLQVCDSEGNSDF